MNVYIVMVNDCVDSAHLTAVGAEDGMKVAIRNMGGIVPPPKRGEETPRTSIAGQRADGMEYLYARVYEMEVQP